MYACNYFIKCFLLQSYDLQKVELFPIPSNRCKEGMGYRIPAISKAYLLIQTSTLILHEACEQVSVFYLIRRPPFSIPGLFELFYNFSYFGQYFCTTRLAMKGQGRTLFNQQCLKIVHKTSYLKTSLVKVQPWPFITEQFVQIIDNLFCCHGILCTNTQHKVLENNRKRPDTYYIGTSLLLRSIWARPWLN